MLGGVCWATAVVPATAAARLTVLIFAYNSKGRDKKQNEREGLVVFWMM